MFSPEDRSGRRAMFDQVAELYDRARPGYPAELHSDLVELAGLGPGSRVLEIGCGSPVPPPAARMLRYGDGGDARTRGTKADVPAVRAARPA